MKLHHLLLLTLFTSASFAAKPSKPPSTPSLAAKTHIVVAKDTLSAIARKYSVTVQQLKSANNLSSDLIRIGQSLKIPGDPAPTPPEQPSAPAQTAGPLDALRQLSTEDRWKLHIFLDRQLFAPGKVDGLIGEFTLKAAERWIAASPGRSLTALISAARDQVKATAFTHKIPEVATKFVGPLPTQLEAKAAAKSLPYESLAEFVAERYKTDLATLRRLNPGKDLSSLKVGDSVQVPAVTPFFIESWPTAGLSKATQAGTSLRIQHLQHLLEVLNAEGQVTAVFPITVGSKPQHLRSGTWSIRSLTPFPQFVWDDLMLKEGRTGPKQYLLPPGPNNPVGILWMEIEPLSGPEAHIGIHGTADPARIGRNSSSGCIRLANWDIARLSQIVGKGTRIVWAESQAADSAVLAAR